MFDFIVLFPFKCFTTHVSSLKSLMNSDVFNAGVLLNFTYQGPSVALAYGWGHPFAKCLLKKKLKTSEYISVLLLLIHKYYYDYC